MDGIDLSWIGVGVSYPCARTPAITFSFRLNDSKLIELLGCIHFWIIFNFIWENGQTYGIKTATGNIFTVLL
jgi:hypothetical protein